MGRLTELAAKLEEDLLAADGGGIGGRERRENVIDGIIADGVACAAVSIANTRSVVAVEPYGQRSAHANGWGVMTAVNIAIHESGLLFSIRAACCWTRR